MLYEIMRHIKNFFVYTRFSGKYKITNSTIDLSYLENGDYFLIEGSRRNDGVWKYGSDTLTDEEFEGFISVLAPPKDFIALCNEIKDYTDKSNSAISSHAGYASESFGGYSYSLDKNNDGGIVSWKDAFRSRLNVWRKI